MQSRAVTAGFAATALGGHSLSRGAMNTGMGLGAHPSRLKRLSRHRSYAVRTNTPNTATRSRTIRSAGCSERHPARAPSPA